MIAVSSVLYRLYTNVLRSLTTDWCQRHSKIPQTQFGFYPGRNTLQPLFILRHLIHLQQHRRAKKQILSPLIYAAFMDFTQAYDHVAREQLWHHLQPQGTPPWRQGSL